MNNFKAGGFKKQGSGYEGRSKTGGHRGSNSSSSRPTIRTAGNGKPAARPADMFQATCSTCKADCKLPFRPNTDKPVYCSECFSKKNADQARNDSKGAGNKFKPAERTVRPDSEAKQNYELAAIKRQLQTIEDRLNRVLDIINPPLPAKKSAAPQLVE